MEYANSSCKKIGEYHLPPPAITTDCSELLLSQKHNCTAPVQVVGIGGLGCGMGVGGWELPEPRPLTETTRRVLAGRWVRFTNS